MARSTALLLCAALAAAGPAFGQEILRESVGSRAADLAKLELQPFDQKLWTTLTGWTNGSALDAGATDGKVVLIATWAAWNPRATQVIPTIQGLQEKYAEQGILVVGVHHTQGWDRAAEALSSRNADFLIAHDADGKFREGLKADQDPDFYVIDRAGQLRFADIRNESVEAAVTQLLAEDVSAASSVRGQIAEEARKRDLELARPKTIEDAVNLSSLPEVPFVDPAPESYQTADWPKPREDDDNRRRDEEQGPSPVPVPGAGWLGGTPPVTRGRAVVYYSWTLENPRSSDVCRRMDMLQKQLGRDVVVVGVLTLQDDNNRRDDEAPDPAALQGRAESFRRLHDIQHPIVVDPEGSIMQIEGSNRSNNTSISTAMVVSSDNIRRWQGFTADPAFRAALDRVLKIDPGVQARRAAESAYIRARGG